MVTKKPVKSASAKVEPLLLPALRGSMGDWVYYTCLVPLNEIAKRVEYADTIHADKALSQLIQRQLEGGRSMEISTYLKRTPQRFFNALVLATYDGRPEWLEVGNLRAVSQKALYATLDEQALDTMGFLSLNGNERIFAVDGQHRLAGIKRARDDGFSGGEERVTAIFIAHAQDEPARTRRLFTTLNKTARPVKKLDIIALDEDDTMAIIARRLVEENAWFRNPKILVASSESLPVTNRISLTTIANLYDVLKIAFRFKAGVGTRDAELRFFRPSDAVLDQYQMFAVKYFSAIAATFPPVDALFKARDPATVTQLHRGPHGGHILFRPAGLDIFTRLAVDVAKKHELNLPEAVKWLDDFPVELDARPYRDVLWNPSTGKMVVANKTLARDLLRYMFGLDVDVAKLRKRYASARGDDNVKLPRRLREP
ncbi:DGQHR domain-containing protein [Dyella sp. A6]|uniref:DGQHR domain-containing protein n=1 Tax=Dyella aluminiiresistens TaxID=3069105 RepID=UPI002E759F81|nr:DGQHR domain-containing protein [Dyella sp. A6]